MSKQEQNDYAELGETTPVFPKALTVLGIIWFAVGCLILLVLLASSIFLLITDGFEALINSCNLFLFVLIGAAINLILSGRKCVLGKIKDTTNLVLWSIGFTIICTGISFVFFRLSANFGNGPPIKSWENFWYGFIAASAAIMFSIAAIVTFLRNPTRTLYIHSRNKNRKTPPTTS